MKDYDKENKDQHFFVATLYGWAVDVSLPEAMKKAKDVAKLGMRDTPQPGRGRYPRLPKKHRVPGVVFHVPVAVDAHYEIREYTPQVDGSTLIYVGDL